MKWEWLSQVGTTDAGYQLYDPAIVSRVREIRRLQTERLTLKEIKLKLRRQPQEE